MMFLNATRFTVFLLLTCCMLPGCMRFGQRPPAKTSYVITAERPPVSTGTTGAEILQVTPMRISPRFNGRSFVYRQGASQYRRDYYHQFLIAPASLIQEEVVRWLASSHLMGSVSTSAGPLPPDYLLQGQIVDLYGDYREAQPGAVLEITFLLLEHRAPDTPVRLQRTYRRTVPTADDTPDALIEGWNTALAHILQDLETDLKRTLTASGVTPPGIQ